MSKPYTVRGASLALGISQEDVLDLINSGDLPHYRNNIGDLRINRDDISRHLAKKPISSKNKGHDVLQLHIGERGQFATRFWQRIICGFSHHARQAAFVVGNNLVFTRLHDQIYKLLIGNHAKAALLETVAAEGAYIHPEEGLGLCSLSQLRTLGETRPDMLVFAVSLGMWVPWAVIKDFKSAIEADYSKM